jgi:hypothetical protein
MIPSRLRFGILNLNLTKHAMGHINRLIGYIAIQVPQI